MNFFFLLRLFKSASWITSVFGYMHKASESRIEMRVHRTRMLHGDKVVGEDWRRRCKAKAGPTIPTEWLTKGGGVDSGGVGGGRGGGRGGDGGVPEATKGRKCFAFTVRPARTPTHTRRRPLHNANIPIKVG